MSSYRFCRTDDIGLLVDALNRCWRPHFPDEDPMTPAAFKRSIRDLQVWCSSCMVAFSGGEPAAVLIGAKRPSATLIHRIAVHPDHLRQGHGRHLLDSLSSKLSILGPPRISAEIPGGLAAASRLFEASGYVPEAVLTDYVWRGEGAADGVADPMPTLTIPVTVDDLLANGLLGPGRPQTCWERSVETLTARKDEIAGLAAATDERIEAWLLYTEHAEIVSIGAFGDDRRARLKQLLAQVRSAGTKAPWIRKVHPSEISPERLAGLGFEPAGSYRLYGGTARRQ